MGCSGADPLNYYFCGKSPRLAGRGADITCFGQRSATSALPTIPALNIRM